MGQKQRGEARRRHSSGTLALPLLPSRGEELGRQKERNSSHPHLRF